MTVKRIGSILQPAVWLGMTAGLVIVLSLLFRSAAPGTGQEDNGTAAGSEEPPGSETPTETASPEIVTSTATPEPCFALAEGSDVMIFYAPVMQSDTPPQGVLFIGESAPVLATTTNEFQELWLLIDREGQRGWGWVLSTDVTMQGTCPAGLEVTLTPTPTSDWDATWTPYATLSAAMTATAALTLWPPAPTSTPAPDELTATPVCSLALTAPRDVYNGPGMEHYDVISTLERVTVQVYGYYRVQGAQMEWLVVDYQGLRGWIARTPEDSLVGACDNLPVIQPPTTPAPGGVDVFIEAPGEVGTVVEHSGIYTGTATDQEQVIQVRVNIPPAEGNAGHRAVEFQLVCSGSGADALRWSWWIEEQPLYACGETLRSDGLLWSASTVSFHIIGSAGTSVPWVLRITVGEYRY